MHAGIRYVAGGQRPERKMEAYHARGDANSGLVTLVGQDIYGICLQFHQLYLNKHKMDFKHDLNFTPLAISILNKPNWRNCSQLHIS